MTVIMSEVRTMAHNGTYVFALIDARALLAHEQVEESHVFELVSELRSDGELRCPVIVDRNSFVILDGHHRVKALAHLGCRLVPAYLLDYMDDEAITVSPRRENLPVDKRRVVEAARKGVLFPPRSSRHKLIHEPGERPVPLRVMKALA